MQRLNKIEKLKAAMPPFSFRQRLRTLDPEALTEADRFYLKNFGIYNIKLRPEAFMIRLRIAGGRIDRQKVRILARIADEYDLKIVLTTRAQIELHNLDAKNLFKVYDLLRRYRFSSLQTLSDNVRNIVTDPYDGLLPQSPYAVYPLIEKMQDFVLDDPEWMGMLPRKFNTAITANEACHEAFFHNDLLFAPAAKGRMRGFNLYLGGKNSETARSANLFVLYEEVFWIFVAVLRAYRRYGLRASRSKARLFHLLREISMERFREYIGEFSSVPLRPEGKLLLKKVPIAPFRELSDGRYGVCYQTRFGEISSRELSRIADFVEKKGLEIRLSTSQNLHLLGLDDKKTPFARIEGASHTFACAGSRYCALSLWDVKGETSYLPMGRIERLDIRVGFSGCLKGCGHHHHVDIGLVGLRTNLFGPTDKAARLFLGGVYTRGLAPARLLFYVVPLAHLHEVVSEILDAFEESGFSDFERYSMERLNRFSEGLLRLWLLARLYLRRKIALEAVSEARMFEKLRTLEGFPEEEDYEGATRLIMHALWDTKK